MKEVIFNIDNLVSKELQQVIKLQMYHSNQNFIYNKEENFFKEMNLCKVYSIRWKRKKDIVKL